MWKGYVVVGCSLEFWGVIIWTSVIFYLFLFVSPYSSDLDQVSLKAELGKFQTHIIPLRNAGNIPIEVSMEVTHHQESFITIPSQLMIEPGGQSEVMVKFEPKNTIPQTFERFVFLGSVRILSSTSWTNFFSTIFQGFSFYFICSFSKKVFKNVNLRCFFLKNIRKRLKL